MTVREADSMSTKQNEVAERRGFLRALGLGGVAAASAAGAVEAAGTYDPQRADAVPPALARKEDAAERVKARYQANAADVQAYYRTNRYGG